MTCRTVEEVRAAIVSYIEPTLRSMGLSPLDVHDRFDLRGEGVVDSLGFLQLLSELEMRLGVVVAFDEMDPDSLTLVGPLSRYIAERNNAGAAGS